MAVGFGHAFDSERMLRAAGACTGDESGGVTQINETPMRGLTARMVVADYTAQSAASALRFRILSANNSASVFQTVAASPAINGTAMGSVGTDGLEVNVRFGTDWDYIKYVIDTFGTVSCSVTLGLVEDAVKFPDWDWFGDSGGYWVDGTDVQL